MTNTYNCIRCNFQTNRKSILINHLNKKNKCKKNLNIYFIPNYILNEISNIPNNNDSEFKCNYCLKNFSCKYNLNRHQITCEYKNKKKQNILVKYKLYNELDINKYINDFYNLTILKYFEKNKIYNSFYKPWNLNHIDILTKKLLYITNDKFSDLLIKILTNDKNINIIYDKNESYGYIVNNDHNIEIIYKKRIVDETMKKIMNTFDYFKHKLEENNKIIDRYILNNEYEIIQEKYNSFLSIKNINLKVENIILNIYSDKFFEIQNNALYLLNNKNIGF